MSNDPRDLGGKKLVEALRYLGRDTKMRNRVVDFLRTIEPELQYPGSVRDDVIGPVVDALHEETDIYAKQLADGTKIHYLYRTKIARDLLLASGPAPTHVWEPQTTKLLLHVATWISGDVLVGGAYFGDQAVLVAKALHGRGLKVHCFEPNNAQAGMLRENIRINRLDNLEVNELGLWHQSGERMKLDGFDSFANAVLVADGEGFRTTTIDDYMRGHHRPVGMIQLDIEGAELSALQGAAQTLANDKPVVIFELHRSYVDWSDGLRQTPICKLLLDLGYAVYAIRDLNSHREMPAHKIELVEIDHVYLEGPPHGFNMLALPPDRKPDPAVFRLMRGVSPKLLPHKTPSLHHPTEGFDYSG